MPLVRLFLLIGLAGCGSDPRPRDFKDLPPDEAAAGRAARANKAPLPATPDAALAHAEAAAQETGKGLKQRLQAALQAGGPVEAVSACHAQAPAVAADVASQRAVTVGRSSLRLRNPDNAAAPAWVGAWLAAQGDRPAAGVTGIAEVATTADGAVARVLKPIAVEPVCVTCHGPRDAIAPAVADRIATLYPDDAAYGYAVGDLRGALWVEFPVPKAD